eukprot:4704516-Pleurochrysis_carterae.AAC.2
MATAAAAPVGALTDDPLPPSPGRHTLNASGMGGIPIVKKHRHRVHNRSYKSIRRLCHRHAYIGTAQIGHLWLIPGLLPAQIAV